MPCNFFQLIAVIQTAHMECKMGMRKGAVLTASVLGFSMTLALSACAAFNGLMDKAKGGSSVNTSGSPGGSSISPRGAQSIPPEAQVTADEKKVLIEIAKYRQKNYPAVPVEGIDPDTGEVHLSNDQQSVYNDELAEIAAGRDGLTDLVELCEFKEANLPPPKIIYHIALAAVKIWGSNRSLHQQVIGGLWEACARPTNEVSKKFVQQIKIIHYELGAHHCDGPQPLIMKMPASQLMGYKYIKLDRSTGELRVGICDQSSNESAAMAAWVRGQ